MDFKITKKGDLVRVYASSEEKEVIIPFSVKTIRKHAFDDCKHVEQVTIPDSVETIAESAFMNTKIKKIIIPSSVRSIGQKAFSDCYDLESIQLNCNLESLEKDLFNHCRELKELNIPESVLSIGENVFHACYSLKRITIPKSVRTIGKCAFHNCSDLEEVTFEGKIVRFEDGLFKECGSLKKINIPDSLESIGNQAFYACQSIESIELPDSVNSVGKGAFYWCSKLKKIKLSNSLTVIDDSCFNLCIDLKEIELPQALVSIGNSAFANSGIRAIDFPSNLEEIGDRAFSWCNELSKILIPKSVKSIGVCAFHFCEKLEKVEILSPLKEIPTNTFGYCKNLDSITLPNSIEYIGKYAFCSCHKIEEIQLPSSLTHIDEAAFEDCDNLKNVLISEKSNLMYISSKVFSLCKSLRNIVLPNKLRHISNKCFQDSGIQSIDIPDSVVSIGENAFSGCTNLKRLEIPETVHSISKQEILMCEEIRIRDLQLLNQSALEDILPTMRCYFNDSTGEVILSKEVQYQDGYREIICGNRYQWQDLSMRLVTYMLFDDKQLEKVGRLGDFLPKIMKNNVTKNNYKEFKQTLINHKEFNRLVHSILLADGASNYSWSAVSTNGYDLFRLSYSLGIFNDNPVDRQRACNFLINLFEKNLLNKDNIHASFDSLNFRSYNKDWAEFLMNKNNLPELIRLEKEQTGFISRICNSFEEIKEFGRSNRGSQNYRKVTIEMCREYLSKSSFEGVDITTMDISEEISKYTHQQDSFNKAVQIRDEYIKLKKDGKIDDHLLMEDLFSKIEEIKKDILEDTKDVLANLNVLANQSFTYEFLSKYDPKNFVLGKYCSCCAHLEGQGHGIMRASILHPDCQNLVIKNKDGKIIAKSTLYVNRAQGYGIFNNIEVNTNITDKKTKMLIYIKYMEAIKSFAIRYNEINKDNPLSQINVGMNLNDLSEYILENNEKSSHLLEGINFSKYGGYIGDWQNEQYVVWKNTNINCRK